MRTNPRQWYANQTFAMFVLPLLFGIFNGNFLKKTDFGADHYKIKTVVIDAGHGGKDPGCAGNFSHEKDNALAVALALGAKIEAEFPQVKVIYTRETDVFIPLIDRARIANEAKADLFISIHCNSLPVRKQSIDGTEVYVLGLHVAERNLDVAKRENEAIYLEKDYQKTYTTFDPDSPEGNIFFSAWQSAYLEQSIAFASLVNDAVAETGRNGRGVKQAGFMVLKETAAPSVLIETGYLTSDTDENYIGNAEGQDHMAAVIFGAFSDWKSQMEGGPATTKKSVVSKKPANIEQKKAVLPQKNANLEVSVSPVSQKKAVGAVPEKAVVGDATNGQKVASNAPKTGQATNLVKILLTTSEKKLNPKKDPFTVIGKVEEQKINGEYRYFATGFSTKTEAKKALQEIRSLGFPNAKLAE